MLRFIQFAQIITSVLVVAVILMQNKGAGVSAVFGGGESGVSYTRRGPEKWLFYATIGLVVFFIALGILSLFIQRS